MNRPARVYNPRLDGVRCFAVLAVVLFHARVFAAGWIGVQIFFVLSGYLITDILLADRERLGARAFFARFYWRRCLRIFPLYFAFLGGSAVCFALTGFPERFGTALPSLLTYTFNLRLAFGGDLPISSSYSHLWSLAIEEQFYLVWPFLIYWLSAKALRRVLLGLIIGAPVLRFVIPILLQRFGGFDDYRALHAVYVLTPSHLDAFALGACVAAGSPIFKVNTGSTLGLATGLLVAFGLIVIFTARFAHDAVAALGYPIWLPSVYQYVWGYTVLNFFAAALIAFLQQPPTLGKIFEFPAIVFVGRISYGIYVVHKAVQFMAWHFLQPAIGSLADYALVILSTAAAILVAAASYYWFESPFLRRKNSAPFGRRKFASNG